MVALNRRQGCPYCGPALPSELVTIASTNAGQARPSTRHGHRLFLLLTGTCWRFWWAPNASIVKSELRQRRYGQGAMPSAVRPATLADIARALDCGGVR